MNKETDHLETLSEIRSMMERSSRFITLSGLSGVFAGLFALAGAAAAYMYLNIPVTSPAYYEHALNENGEPDMSFYTFFFTDALVVLTASVIAAFILTMRRARQKGQTIWNPTSKRLLVNMLIPLVTGGLFCLSLLYHGSIGMIAPSTLLFYGLALLNASKYTLDDVRYLGVCQIALGLIASVYTGYGLLIWAMGFGVVHIIYGIAMYYKYER